MVTMIAGRVVFNFLSSDFHSLKDIQGVNSYRSILYTTDYSYVVVRTFTYVHSSAKIILVRLHVIQEFRYAKGEKPFSRREPYQRCPISYQSSYYSQDRTIREYMCNSCSAIYLAILFQSLHTRSTGRYVYTYMHAHMLVCVRGTTCRRARLSRETGT